jgi:hypothetical protein
MLTKSQARLIGFERAALAVNGPEDFMVNASDYTVAAESLISPEHMSALPVSHQRATQRHLKKCLIYDKSRFGYSTAFCSNFFMDIPHGSTQNLQKCILPMNGEKRTG